VATGKPLEALVFFIDRSLGGKLLPAAIRATGRTVEAHDDHFPPETPDTVWISDVASRRWIILTKDDNITRNPLELDALLYSGARAFVLTTTHITGAEQAEIVVHHLARMEALARRRKSGFVARLNRTEVRVVRTGLTKQRGRR
jgi:hypothetical protein